MKRDELKSDLRYNLNEMREYILLRFKYAASREHDESENADGYCIEYWKGEKVAYANMLRKIEKMVSE